MSKNDRHGQIRTDSSLPSHRWLEFAGDSRRVGLNRKTVTRYIREYEAQVSSDPEEGADMCLVSRPKYPPRNVERSKLTDVVCAEIEYCLSENAMRPDGEREAR